MAKRGGRAIVDVWNSGFHRFGHNKLFLGRNNSTWSGFVTRKGERRISHGCKPLKRNTDNCGTLTKIDGSLQSIPFFNLTAFGSLVSPVNRVVTALADMTVSLQFAGLVTVNDRPSYIVRITPAADPSVPLPPELAGLGSIDLFIDSTSYQIIKLSEILRNEHRLDDTYTHEIVFSNYRVNAGIRQAFQIDEYFAGQHTWSIALASVVFNSGLTDSDFQPPPVPIENEFSIGAGR
jgi:hypothetical protein